VSPGHPAPERARIPARDDLDRSAHAHDHHRRPPAHPLQRPAHRLDLWLERGQIQVLNNRVIVHGRTAYQDADEPEHRRHLVRLWLLAGDRRHFRG
jgi:alpha-ketoglutarate-dependent taurine dioxygenase